MRRTSTLALVCRVGAGLVLAAFVVGVPVLLQRFGSPLPSRVPSWSGFVTDVRVGYVPAAVLAKVALAAAWAVWLFLGFEIVAETGSWVRNQGARRSSALGPLQPLLSRLVAVAVLSTPLPRAVAGSTAPALRAPVVALTAESAPASLPPAAAPAASTPLPTYVVQPHDTLWAIAERHLGNPLRWSEIAALNEGRLEGSAHFGDPHWIYPGWVLELPADATGLEIQPGTPATAPAPSPPAPTPSVVPSSPVGSGAPSASAPGSTDSAPAPTPEPGEEVKPPTGLSRPVSAGPHPLRPRSENGNSQAWAVRHETPPHRGPVVPIGAGVLGAGVLALLARMRRAQQRHRQPGRRIALPTGALATVETGLHSSDDPDAARWVELAVRLLSTRLTGASNAPKILGLVVGAERLELVVEGPPADPPPPFEMGASGHWVLPRVDEVAELAQTSCDEPAALPTLVTVGRNTDGVVLLNLEVGGIVSITGGAHSVRAEIVHAMAIELATCLWVDALTVCAVGDLAAAGLPFLERLELYENFDDVLVRVTSHATSARALLDSLDEPDVATARMRGVQGSWEPIVVLADHPPGPSAAGALGRLDDAHLLGISVVVPGEVAGARWNLVLGEDGLLLEPLGLTVAPQHLGTAQVSGIAGLLQLAGGLADVAPDAPPYDALAGAGDVHADSPLTTSDLSFDPSLATASVGGTELDAPRIHVLGPVRLEGAEQPPRRAKMLELIVWLALHPPGADLDTAATALWPERAPAPRTLWTLTWGARQALGNRPDGEPYLPRYERLSLDPAVTSDWRDFQALASSPDLGAWHRALGLVRGPPFAEADWPWAVTEGLAAAMESEIVDLAAKVSEAACAREDLATAAWAAEQGLLASPYDERLYRLLMRIADRSGNPAGVKAVMARLSAVLAEEVEPADAVHPETWALYERLTATERRDRRTSSGVPHPVREHTG